MTPRTRTPEVAGYRQGRVPRAVREQQLLEHAERLLVEKGYSDFSIEDLCRAARVSRPVVYDHFGTKDGVYLACLRRIRDELERSLVHAATSADDLPSAVRQGARAYFEIVEREPRRWSLVYGGTTVLAGPIADELFDLRTGTIRRIADIAARFASGVDPESLDAYAQALSGAGEQLARWWLRHPEIPRERVVEHFVRIGLGVFAAVLGPDVVTG